MTLSELTKLISQGEGPSLEFKARVPDALNLARSVCALLNSHGGRVLIGVDENGRVKGVNQAESVAKRLEVELTSAISPSAVWTVEPVAADVHQIVVVEVPEGVDKPYVVGGAIYVRRDARTLAADRNEITALIDSRVTHSSRWERQLLVGVDLDALDAALIQDTARLAQESGRWQGDVEDIGRFLSSLGLASNGSLTNASVLLFGKEPTKFFPQGRVRLLVLPEGKTGDRYAFDKLLDGCLVRIAEDLPKLVEQHAGDLTVSFPEAGWKREERIRYPRAALREGIMNAIVHRDYDSTGTVTISISGDRLEVMNPGGLPPELKVADLKRNHPSVPRNPDIAHVFFLRLLIEKVGRGTQLIVEACKAAKLPEPRWESSAAATTLTFFSGDRRSRIQSEDELSARQQRLLEAVRTRGQLSAADAVAVAGNDVSDRTVRYDLARLVDAGHLVKHGSARAVFYAMPKKGR